MLRRNVLILHAGALGDFLLTWPLIMALARLHPQSRIIVVAQHSKGALAEVALKVEHTDIENGWHAIHAAGATPSDSVARLISGAHSIYSFVSAPDDAAGENLARLAGPEAIVVPLIARPPADFHRHATDFLLDQLTANQAVRAGVEQMIRGINQRGISAGRSDGGDIVIHPGSGSVEKCWPVDRFVKLIGKLKRKKRNVRVLLGEVELERLRADDIAALQTIADVRKRQTYVDLLNELRTASTVITNDSGPAHLAAMIGVPTVTLFGPSDPIVWKPLGPRVTVIAKPKIDQITVDEVAHAVA